VGRGTEIAGAGSVGAGRDGAGRACSGGTRTAGVGSGRVGAGLALRVSASGREPGARSQANTQHNPRITNDRLQGIGS